MLDKNDTLQHIFSQVHQHNYFNKSQDCCYSNIFTEKYKVDTIQEMVTIEKFCVDSLHC